jgi:hypothetical protein
MKRRQFFGLASGALAALAIWRLSKRDHEAIALMLYTRLHYLKLDAEGVQRFARDFALRNDLASTRLHLINALGPAYRILTNSPAASHIFAAVHHGEERIITNYLIGSDFFINGADVTRVVHFLGLMDPLQACGNPFARPPEGLPA